MNTGVDPEQGPHWMLLASEDLRALAWLHAAERTPDELRALHLSGFPQTLALLASGHPAKQAMETTLQAVEGTLQGLPTCSADELAADYAGIYLTHALRAAPLESVWRDEDHLMLQAPTFAVRSFYQRHGVQAADWRVMSEDHLTHELSFVALLLERGEDREAARFLRAHLLTWLPAFAARVAQRATTPFYAALAVLTEACVEACAARLPRVAVIPPAVAAPVQGGCGHSALE